MKETQSTLPSAEGVLRNVAIIDRNLHYESDSFFYNFEIKNAETLNVDYLFMRYELIAALNRSLQKKGSFTDVPEGLQSEMGELVETLEAGKRAIEINKGDERDKSIEALSRALTPQVEVTGNNGMKRTTRRHVLELITEKYFPPKTQ